MKIGGAMLLAEAVVGPGIKVTAFAIFHASYYVWQMKPVGNWLTFTLGEAYPA
jgi:hypothetical protein